MVNLKFLNTLMVDKASSDKWETFINAKGPQLETMSTQQLYAEVRVNAGRIKPVEPVPNEVKALQTELQQSLQASPLDLTTFQRNNRNNDGSATAKEVEETIKATLATMVETMAMVMTIVVKAKTTKIGDDIPMTRISPVNYTEGDTVRMSVLHSRGRLANSSRHLAKISTISNETTYGDYQPNFNNRQFTANVTRLSVNNTQIARTSDPSAWIMDSAANAFITPFKERLHNYRQFKEEVQVKGFDGNPEMAVGSGSITLTDHRGNRLTLNDVVYVPGCTEQILSLMKLRRLYGADFAFTSLEEFIIPFPNGVSFSGKSVNDVLYIWESTSLISNAVTTRSALATWKELCL